MTKNGMAIHQAVYNGKWLTSTNRDNKYMWSIRQPSSVPHNMRLYSLWALHRTSRTAVIHQVNEEYGSGVE